MSEWNEERRMFTNNTYSFFIFGGQGEEELYDTMTRLAAVVPSGSEGLRCSPLFTGTRGAPTVRGDFTRIAPHNFTPGHFVRALLEGIAEEFYKFYHQMKPLIGERNHGWVWKRYPT